MLHAVRYGEDGRLFFWDVGLREELKAFRPRLVVAPLSQFRDARGFGRRITPNGGTYHHPEKIYFNGTDSYIDAGADALGTSSSAHTVLLVATLRSFPAGTFPVVFNYYTTSNAAADRRKIFFAAADTGYNPVTFGKHGSTTPAVRGFDCTEVGGRTSLTGKRASWVFREAGANSYAAWCNGIKLADNGSAVDTNTQTGDICIGRASTNDASGYAPIDLHLLVYFDAALPPALCALLSKDPSQVFEETFEPAPFFTAAAPAGGTWTSGPLRSRIFTSPVIGRRS